MRSRGAGLIVVAVATLAVAGPAGAGTQSETKSLGKAGGLEYLSAKFPQVVSPAGATATCPGDDRVVGGGAIIGGGDSSNLWMTALTKDFAGWQGQASSIDGATQTTYAICETAPDVDLELGFMSVPPMSNSYSQTFTCDSGSSVVSGGYVSDGTDFYVEAFSPYDSDDADAQPDDGWFIQGTNPSLGTVNPAVFFFCSESLKLSYATKEAEIDPDGGASLKAKCPKETVVTGGGFEAGFGKATGLTPWDSKDKRKTPEDGWRAAVHNITGSPMDFDVTAICIKG